MRTDFNINVHVDLGVTPELVALVNAILNKTEQPTATTVQPQAQPEEQPASEEPKPKRSRKAKPQETEQSEQADDTPEIIRAIEEQQEELAAEHEKQKEYTTEDVREAMERTRIRIEGEDYKNNTESDGYKKYHRALTQQFKLIAATLDADKPSALPAEQIPSFIKQCEELTILEDGSVGTKCPF